MTATATGRTADAERARAPRRRGDRVFAGIARARRHHHHAGPGRRSSSSWPSRAGPASRSADATYAPATTFVGYIWPLIFGTHAGRRRGAGHRGAVRDRRSRCSSPTTHRGGIAAPVAYVIDLLAAVPSVVFGLWGGRYLARLPAAGPRLAARPPRLPPVLRPARRRRPVARCSPPAIVLAIMILPIITAISREVFAQTPRLHEEAALALGATRWEMIRLRRLPLRPLRHGLGVMLGLGRALGETMAVAMVLSATPVVDPQPDRHGATRRRSPPTSPSTTRRRRRGRQSRADRHRPGAVRGHVRGQLRGPLGRRPQRAEAWRTT